MTGVSAKRFCIGAPLTFLRRRNLEGIPQTTEPHVNVSVCAMAANQWRHAHYRFANVVVFFMAGFHLAFAHAVATPIAALAHPPRASKPAKSAAL